MAATIRRYRSLGEDIYQWARTDRYGRWALRAAWFGLLVLTTGLFQLHVALRHNWR
ncbi:hypothetical protein [Micromonospora marina]|uniref:hypothetical protein n=1 Tax=Micromonospora marina TaxID=307120 RepID=UPI003D708DF9